MIAPLRDPHVFTDAYRRLAATAHAAAASVLRDGAAAEDVVQDVFCAIWMHPEGCEPDRGSLATYVRIMARSRALDRVRGHAVAAAALRRTQMEAGTRPAVAEAPSDTLIRRDGTRTLLHALDDLPDVHRTAVLLHHVGGLSDRELADATRVPLGTAKSRIRAGTLRARAAVEARLAA